MDDILKSIFYAAVESVKPAELITKKKVLNYERNERNEEIVEIKCDDRSYKLDVTDKNIHIGN
jgi:hypothetical protein